jgi:hypothetical protein
LEYQSPVQHQPTFDVTVSTDSYVLGKGSGKRKKEAEQDAAKDALYWMKQFVISSKQDLLGELEIYAQKVQKQS